MSDALDSGRVSASMTRPSDTNNYTAGDLFGTTTSNSATNILTIPLFRYINSSVLLSRISGKINSSAFASKRFRLHLYRNQPTITSIGDNGAFANATVATESSKYGTVDITLGANATSDGYVKGWAAMPDAPYWVLDPTVGELNIYGIIEVLDAVTTPASGAVATFTFEMPVRN